MRDPQGYEIRGMPHKFRLSKDDNDDDCYSAALPEPDGDYYSSAGYKESVSTPSTCTTAPVSDDMESSFRSPFGDSERPARTTVSEDADNLNDSDSVTAKKTKRTKKSSRTSSDKASKWKIAKVMNDDDNISKKSSKSKKKKSKKVDYSGLSLMALKLELQVCGVSTNGLKDKQDYVRALENFKKAESKQQKSKTPTSATKFARSQSTGMLEKSGRQEQARTQSLGQFEKYAENDKVLYVSSNGDSEKATILKVHLDDDLVPFYDIRLEASGREKQTDDAHLKALPVEPRKRPVKPLKKSQPPMRRSSTTSMRSSTTKSKRTSERPGVSKKFAENDKVIYVSSNGEKESATILKVHLDDDLVPFYDIRLKSGREKQTDDAHLTALPQRQRPSKKTSTKPKRHNSMGALSRPPAEYSFTPASTPSTSTGYSFTSDLLNTTTTSTSPKRSPTAPERRSSLTFGSSLPDGFVSPMGKKSSSKPKRNKSLSKFDQPPVTGSLNLNDSSSVTRKRPSKGAVPRRIKSLSAQSSTLSPKSPPNRSTRLALGGGGNSVRQRPSKSNRRASVDGMSDYRIVSPKKSPGAMVTKAKKMVKATS